MTSKLKWLCVQSCPGLDWNGRSYGTARCSVFNCALVISSLEAPFRSDACVANPKTYNECLASTTGKDIGVTFTCTDCLQRRRGKGAYKDRHFCLLFRDGPLDMRRDGEPRPHRLCDAVTRAAQSKLAQEAAKTRAALDAGGIPIDAYCPYTCQALNVTDVCRAWCDDFILRLDASSSIPLRCSHCLRNPSESYLAAMGMTPPKSTPVPQTVTAEPEVPVLHLITVPHIIVDLGEEENILVCLNETETTREK